MTSKKPSLVHFAEVWKSMAFDEDGTPRKRFRQALADHYGVSLPTIDKWVRECRDKGIIPETERAVLNIDEVRRRMAQSSEPAPQQQRRRPGRDRRGVRRRG